MDRSFLSKFAAVFGRKEALMLKLAELKDAETTAAGPWVRTETSDEWMDFGSFGIHLLGHTHPRIVAVARDQLGKMGLSTKILGNREAAECGERLLGIAPPDMRKVVLGNSGAESVEFALKAALLRTGRKEFAAVKFGYHGKTLAAASVSYCFRNNGSASAPWKVDFLDPEKPDEGERIIRTGRKAALIAEAILGEGGIWTIPEHILLRWRNAAKDVGTIFILDEIQSGLGRCGRIFRSANQLCPDVLLVGKTLGGGLVPISAGLYTDVVMKPGVDDPMLNTSSFAGGALACRIGSEVIEIVRETSFLADVRAKGEACLAALRSRLQCVPLIRDIRGEGLMMAIEFADSTTTGEVLIEAVKRKLLVSFCLSRPEVLRFYPPAVASIAEIEEGTRRLCSAVESGVEKCDAGQVSYRNCRM